MFEEVFSDVPIAEAHQGVFAFQDGGEEVEVAGVGGIEAPIGTPPVPAWSGKCGEAVTALRGVWCCCQRMKVVLVGLQ